MNARQSCLLCVILLLAGCERHADETSGPSTGQLVFVTDGATNIRLVQTHFRVYARSLFDSIVLEMTDKTREREHDIRGPTMDAILAALPKAVKEMDTDEDGRFRLPLKGEQEYVMVTNSGCESTSGLEAYRANVPPPEEGTPGTILLSPYTWNAEIK